MLLYKIRKGDLLVVFSNSALVLKTTRKYIYYLYNQQSCRISKKTLWEKLDTVDNIMLLYNNTKYRRKKRKMRVLDLHNTRHKDVEEKLRRFLNFVELPCRIITGKSTKMIKIVENIVKEYEWSASPQPDNPGVLTVTEK